MLRENPDRLRLEQGVEPVPVGQLLLAGLGLAVWMIVLVAISIAVLDEWLGGTPMRG